MSVKEVKSVRDWSLTERLVYNAQTEYPCRQASLMLAKHLVDNEDAVRDVLSKANNTEALISLIARAVNINVEHENFSEANQLDVTVMRKAQERIVHLAAEYHISVDD